MILFRPLVMSDYAHLYDHLSMDCKDIEMVGNSCHF